MRALCLKCLRADSICQCAQIVPFQTEQEWLILMHPREFRKAIGTGRMTIQTITPSTLLVGSSFDEDVALLALLHQPDRFPVLVYPGPQATWLSTTTNHWMPPAGKKLLFVLLDGTWPCAKSLLRKSPLTLGKLPQIAFRPRTPSQYLIRRQPEEECLSTLEAVHELIDLCDQSGIAPAPPGRAHDRMLNLFKEMVQRQARYTLTPAEPDK